mmetsp:Transcript_122705/g.392916  ORF Transcript_122705/g.392916 Transcript_122705/m.392916 type:complete len:291 (+) Transcript_122705:698-1570(+)
MRPRLRDCSSCSPSLMLPTSPSALCFCIADSNSQYFSKTMRDNSAQMLQPLASSPGTPPAPEATSPTRPVKPRAKFFVMTDVGKICHMLPVLSEFCGARSSRGFSIVPTMPPAERPSPEAGRQTASGRSSAYIRQLRSKMPRSSMAAALALDRPCNASNKAARQEGRLSSLSSGGGGVARAASSVSLSHRNLVARSSSKVLASSCLQLRTTAAAAWLAKSSCCSGVPELACDRRASTTAALRNAARKSAWLSSSVASGVADGGASLDDSPTESGLSPRVASEASCTPPTT